MSPLSFRLTSRPVQTARNLFFYTVAAAAVWQALLDGAAAQAGRLVGALAMLLFLAAVVPVLGRQAQLLIAIVVPIGHLLLVLYAPTADRWTQAMTAGGGFALLLGALPFATRFIGMERAATGGSGKSGRRLSLPRVGVIQFGLSVALSIGALWVVRPLYEALSPAKGSRYRSVSAAYSSNVSVSPLDAVVNLVLVLTGLTYTQYMPFGLGLAAVIVAATSAVELGLRLRRHVRGTPRRAAATAPVAGLDAVLLRTALLIVLVVAAKTMLAFESEVLETGVVLAGVSVLLIAATEGPASVGAALREHPGRVGQFVPVFALLGAALFFAETVAGSPVAEAIVSVARGAAALPPGASAVAIILFTAGLALSGVHMLLTVSTLGAVLSPEVLGMSAPAFAVLLITSYIVAMNVSPFVPFTIASAEIAGDRGPLAAIYHALPVWVFVAVVAGIVASFL